MASAPELTPAVVVTGQGVDATLAPGAVALAEPAPGQVRAMVRFAGVNYWDIMQRRGLVPMPDSRVPGVEGVGVVVAAADDVSEWVGRRVAWSRGVPGSYAAEVLAPVTSLVAVPEEIADEEAAAVLMQGVTAEYLAFDTTNLQPGDSALVYAAAGGVGGLLTQMLVSRGVAVTGVVGSEAKVAEAERVGCSAVVLDGDGVVERALEHGAGGYAAVFTANGGPGSVDAIRALRTRGMLVLYGTSGGPIPDIAAGDIARGSFYVTRTAGPSYTSAPGEWARRAAHVFELLQQGVVRPHVSQVLPAREAAAAHQQLEARATIGKILLDTAADQFAG